MTVSGDASCFLTVFFDDLKEMKIWDLNRLAIESDQSISTVV